MQHILQDFSKWKKLNEQDAPGKVKVKGGDHNKVVANPIDKNTLKLKIVNDADVIDAEGKLTTAGFDSILDWIKTQNTIISYYPALNDLGRNIVVYTIAKDNDRKQVVIFKIYNKTELKSQDPSAPGINPQVRFVRQDELTKALNGAILNTKDLQQIVPQADNKNVDAKSDLRFPIPITSVENSKDSKLLGFLTMAYNRVRKEPKVAASKFMPMVKAELQAGSPGKKATLFIKALNSGFAIADDQFPEDIESDITQTLYNKVSSIAEAMSDVIKDFDVDAFLAVVNASQADTGDIKVPAGGFREGMQNDPELKKFQEVLAKKFARHLANHSTYQAFKKAGKKGYLGNYGPLTSALVKLLKMIVENPKYPNSDGTTIEPEFVNMVQKVNETTFNYIGLDGMSLVTESEFNFGNASAIQPATVAASQTRKSPAVSKTIEKSAPGQKYLIEGKDDYEYEVKDGVWHWKKGKGPLMLLTNPASIKELNRKYPKAGGFYIITKMENGNWVRGNKHLYKIDNGTWYVKLSGSNDWTKSTDDFALNRLKDMYGSFENKKQDKLTSTNEIDSLHKKIATTIKSWFPESGSDGPFAEFKGSVFNDNEEKAWEEFKKLWSTGENSIRVKLNTAQQGIARLTGEAKSRCQKNQEFLTGIIKEDGEFKEKFLGGTSDDTFTIALYQEDGTKFRLSINTDF